MNEIKICPPIPKTDVGTNVGNDVGTDVGTDVGSDPKIRRDFIFKRNGKISIDFLLFIYLVYLFIYLFFFFGYGTENLSKN